MRLWLLFIFPLFVTLSYASIFHPERQPLPQFDVRCVQPLQYAVEIVNAKQAGTTEEEILEARVLGQLETYPPQMIEDMVEIIQMVYNKNLDLNLEEDLEELYIQVNDWCTNQLPPVILEDRQWFDEDGNGFPDYDGDGEPIIKYDA